MDQVVLKDREPMRLSFGGKDYNFYLIKTSPGLPPAARLLDDVILPMYTMSEKPEDIATLLEAENISEAWCKVLSDVQRHTLRKKLISAFADSRVLEDIRFVMSSVFNGDGNAIDFDEEWAGDFMGMYSVFNCAYMHNFRGFFLTTIHLTTPQDRMN